MTARPADDRAAPERGVDCRHLVLPSGLRVWVESRGPANAPPVLFVPGWGCSTPFFSANATAVASAGYRAISVDLKGHGRSDKPAGAEEYTLPAMTRHLLDIMDALALERAVLVGQSMGGRIALEVATTAPERVEALALFAPVGLTPLRVVRAARALAVGPAGVLLPRLAGPWVLRPLLRFIYGNPRLVTEREVALFAPAVASADSLRALHHLLRRFAWTPLAPVRLDALRAPALIVLGASDPLVRPVRAALARRYPGRLQEVERARDRHRTPSVQLLWIAGVGHAVNLEASERSAAALLDFLGAASASQGPDEAVARRLPTG